MDKRMMDFAEGYLAAISYLQELQRDCESVEDWDTLNVSIEMLEGEYEMLPIVRMMKDKNAE